MNYTIDYFIEKFEGIPEDRWAIKKFESDGKKCALGHCGVTKVCIGDSYTGSWRTTFTTESHALENIFDKFRLNVITINDDIRYNKVFNANSPKSRIVNALKRFKGTIEYFKSL